MGTPSGSFTVHDPYRDKPSEPEDVSRRTHDPYNGSDKPGGAVKDIDAGLVRETTSIPSSPQMNLFQDPVPANPFDSGDTVNPKLEMFRKQQQQESGYEVESPSVHTASPSATMMSQGPPDLGTFSIPSHNVHSANATASFNNRHHPYHHTGNFGPQNNSGPPDLGTFSLPLHGQVPGVGHPVIDTAFSSFNAGSCSGSPDASFTSLPNPMLTTQSSPKSGFPNHPRLPQPQQPMQPLQMPHAAPGQHIDAATLNKLQQQFVSTFSQIPGSAYDGSPMAHSHGSPMNHSQSSPMNGPQASPNMTTLQNPFPHTPLHGSPIHAANASLSASSLTAYMQSATHANNLANLVSRSVEVVVVKNPADPLGIAWSRRGLTLNRVLPSTPAALCGLEQCTGMTLEKVNGVPVTKVKDFSMMTKSLTQFKLTFTVPIVPIVSQPQSQPNSPPIKPAKDNKPVKGVKKASDVAVRVPPAPPLPQELQGQVEASKMPTVVTVTFKFGRIGEVASIYSVQDVLVCKGQMWVIEAAKGIDLCTITDARTNSTPCSAPQHRLVRPAKPDEVQRYHALAMKDQEALQYVADKARRLKAKVQIHACEFQVDQLKLTIHYSSGEAKPDFRQLVHETFKEYQIRIWMNNCKPSEGQPGDCLDPALLPTITQSKRSAK